MDLILFFVKLLLSVLELTILVLLAVAFITIFERKLLAGYQRRLGPTKVGFLGLFQAIADGVKLIFKEVVQVLGTNHSIFTLAPLVAMVFADAIWFIITFVFNYTFIQYIFSLILIFMILSANAIPFILGGWSSHSRYALLGSLRTAAQMISYEVILALNLLPLNLFTGDFSIFQMEAAQEDLWFIIPFLPTFLFHFIAVSAETARVPFDLPEAEGELVAGYMVEYAAVEFAYFFIAEYTNIFSSALLMAQLFLGGAYALPFFGELIPTSIFWLFIKTFFLFYIMLTARALLPRLRFDQLMYFCWVVALPVTLLLLVIYVLFFFLFL